MNCCMGVQENKKEGEKGYIWNKDEEGKEINHSMRRKKLPGDRIHEFIIYISLE